MEEKAQKINSFIELIDISPHNLVSKNTSCRFHVEDSLKAIEDNQLLKPRARVIDMGSGGGFPVIPLSIYYPDTLFWALEANRKKAEFLKKCAAVLKLNNLQVIRTRAEELKVENGGWDIVTSRAFSHLRILIEVSLPVLKKNGILIAFKSNRQYEEELRASRDILARTGGIVDSIKAYELTRSGELFKGVLVIIRKKSSTPKSYPRQWKKLKSDLAKQN